MSGSLPSSGGYAGAAGFQTPSNDYNAIDFMVRQIIAGKAHAALVLVLSVTNSGGVSPVGSVSVQPMVNQVDGLGNQTPHGTIFNIPYFRLQGGTNAIIIDPQVKDIGIAIMCDRDISSVKATKDVAPPGSSRQHSWADGLYIGGFLNGTPNQYVQFSDAGITLVSPTGITLQAPNIALDGNVTSTGTFANNGSNIGSTHVHPDVQTGSSDTGPPI